ncbi:MAG: hypothetical protein Q9159_006971, partial [Coniocarpon cinnabarinum]
MPHSIWLQELAQHLSPKAKLIGFDSSPSQFPHESWLPPNLKFTAHDCFQPFPSHYLGRYDIVHVRFVVCVLNDEVAAAFLRNIMTLLKPGGYLQWFESAVMDFEVHAPDAATAASADAANRLVQFARQPTAQSSS